ncbi:hypothetical protein ACU6HM_10045 [Alcaligenes sp. RM2]|uniref:hypothetical protein n=1 Tax=unclassified Alcaligenes TaxID=259357 RepID=UPI002227B849|nr:hypothetical protein [Alcaligenes sp. SMD-FA]UYY86965.1 hypothetical protein OKX01_16925 [Alcaligenes sp. SMD-FA]
MLIVLACYGVHASVYASQVSLWAQLTTGGTIMDLVINLMSATCASTANTMFRLKSEIVVVTRIFKELAVGLLVGITAGIITYALSEAAQTNKFLQLGLVTIAGWAGSKVIEFYSGKYFGKEEP